jgi:hypothetical protein
MAASFPAAMGSPGQRIVIRHLDPQMQWSAGETRNPDGKLAMQILHGHSISGFAIAMVGAIPTSRVKLD